METCTYILAHNILLDPLVLETGLQRNGVHAAPAAIVPGRQPILLHTLQLRVAPREEVTAGQKIEQTL